MKKHLKIIVLLPALAIISVYLNIAVIKYIIRHTDTEKENKLPTTSITQKPPIMPDVQPPQAGKQWYYVTIMGIVSNNGMVVGDTVYVRLSDGRTAHFILNGFKK